MVEAMSYISPREKRSEVIARIMIGASAGFTFRYVGLLGRLEGSWLRAAWIAACTSRAAPLMSRFSSNWSVTRVLPSDEDDVISFTPAMRPRARSSGVATVAAITSGLAPGSDADTETTGKSTCGRGETGSSPNDTIPASATPMVSSVVATGRFTNGCVMFIPPAPRRALHARRCAPRGACASRARDARRGRSTGRSRAW
jgi:hypothetical protein